MPKDSDSIIEKIGIVEKVLPGTKSKVKICNADHYVTAHLSGKMRSNHILVREGDKVRLEISTYDIDKARIKFREKRNQNVVK